MDLFEYLIRTTMILFYPFWLFISLLEDKTWKEFKEDMIVPFRPFKIKSLGG